MKDVIFIILYIIYNAITVVEMVDDNSRQNVEVVVFALNPEERDFHLGHSFEETEHLFFHF